MDEFELIRRYFVRQRAGGGVLLGIGDDGAVLSPAPGKALVAVVDTLVESVHWPAALPPAEVGFRALAVNVSDVAAMGGRPRWMTLALTLAAADEEWLAGFSRGLFEAADAFETALVGGDVTRGGEAVVSVQVIGEVDPGQVLRRSAASPGHGIYVTGTFGDAAGGVELLRDPAREARDEDRQFLLRRFGRPEVHVDFAVAAAPLMGAAIDVSDGLAGDLGKVLEASGAGGRVEASLVPRSSALGATFGDAEAERLALVGGDDYELCFTADPAHESAIFETARGHGVRVTRIGDVTAGTGLVLTRRGRELEFSDAGYRHF